RSSASLIPMTACPSRSWTAPSSPPCALAQSLAPQRTCFPDRSRVSSRSLARVRRSALRTGAVSGAATDLLSRPESRILALFGTGAQAVTQAQAVCTVRSIEKIRVVPRSVAKGEAFIERVRDQDAATAAIMDVVTDPEEALRGADIICTATAATTA